jgi:hypothetical protein
MTDMLVSLSRLELSIDTFAIGAAPLDSQNYTTFARLKTSPIMVTSIAIRTALAAREKPTKRPAGT